MPDPSPSPDPSPRNEESHIVPSIRKTIQIDFHVDPVPFRGRLWDLGSSVACLLFPIREPVVPGLVGSLWGDRLESAAYVGVRFLETVDFNTTFLKVLMRRSGGHTPVGSFGDFLSGTAFGSFS